MVSAIGISTAARIRDGTRPWAPGYSSDLTRSARKERGNVEGLPPKACLLRTSPDCPLQSPTELDRAKAYMTVLTVPVPQAPSSRFPAY